MSNGKRSRREHSTRTDVVSGSKWGPFLSTNRTAPLITVTETPAPEATEVAVRSYGNRKYTTRIVTLLANYFLVRDDVTPVAHDPQSAVRVEPLPCAVRAPAPASSPAGSGPVQLDMTTALDPQIQRVQPAAPIPEVLAVPVAPAPVLPPQAVEPIVPSPEDMGVRVYVFRGQPCVIAAAVGKALGYADKSLIKLVRGEWSAELAEPRDFAVLSGDDLREFKRVVALVQGDRTSRNAAEIAVLYETGFDVVLQKTDKPEGAKLRRRLADEVLPKLRRGEAVPPVAPPAAVQPTATAVLDEARLAGLMARAFAEAMPQAIAGAVQVLRPLMLLPGSAPEKDAAPVPTAPPISDNWMTSERIASRLPFTKHRVDKLIAASGIRENASLARQEPSEWTDDNGQRHINPRWRYHPSVLDMIRSMGEAPKPN